MYIKKADILALNNKTVSQQTISKLVNHKCVDGMTYKDNNNNIVITLMDGNKITVTVTE